MDEALDKLHYLVLNEQPQPADAIVWLQGDRYDRGKKVLELYKKSFAPQIVLTGNNVLVGSGPRPGENNISVEEMREWLESSGVPRGRIFIDDTSLNTRDQARAVLALAARYGWKRLILVASPHHQLRAFLTFLKRAEETGWTGELTNQPADLPWDAIPGGAVKPMREIFVEEMRKLTAYAPQVASVATGLAYFERIKRRQETP